MDKTECPNCGAAIYVNEPKCPFCGYINISGAEEKFMRDVKQKEADLSQIPELQKKHYKKSLSKSSRIIIGTVMVVAVIAAILIGLYFAFEALFSYDYEYDAKTEMIWEKENFPLLDELYEAGDYAGILEFEENVYDENAEDGTHHSIFNWEHADFIRVYKRCEYLKEYMDILDKEGELNKYQAENVVYYCMCFHYRDYINEYEEYTDEELELMEEYRTYSESIFFDRLKFTEEEADKLYEDSLEYGTISADKCYKYAKKIKDRFE